MTTYERAVQIYQVLIAAAHQRQILTYELLAQRVGLPAQGLAPHLGRLMDYCQARQLPPITVLVVQKGTGRPGPGLTTSVDPDRDRERVFGHDWYRMEPLSVPMLSELGRSTLDSNAGESTNGAVDKAAAGLRPFGLCAGEFRVPDDFDEPLPEEILRELPGTFLWR